MLTCLIEDVYKPRNLGGILRTSYALDEDKIRMCFYDPRKRLDVAKEEFGEDGYTAYKNIFSVAKYEIIQDLDYFLKNYTGRKVAVEILPDSVPLNRFKFEENDMYIFGNERGGITPRLIDHCDISVIVPMLGKPYRFPDNPLKKGDRKTKLVGANEHTALNVSQTFGIVIYKAMEQLGYFDSFRINLLFPE